MLISQANMEENTDKQAELIINDLLSLIIRKDEDLNEETDSLP